MTKKSSKKLAANYEPTKVTLMVAVVAAVSLVLFVLMAAQVQL